MFRRNRSTRVKLLIFIPLSWVCIILYLNSNGKPLSQQLDERPEEQVAYVNDKAVLDDGHQIVYEVVEPAVNDNMRRGGGPPLRDNSLKKNKKKNASTSTGFHFPFNPTL